ncbi:hypothetical protein FRC03_006602 [Tulasnella sp. 419]|nr:hypothetical protein FRC03_006602 [Tulasnella sp. 419]
MQIDGPQELNGAPPKPSRGKLGVRSAGCKRTRVGFRVPTLPAAKAREARRSGLNHPGKRYVIQSHPIQVAELISTISTDLYAYVLTALLILSPANKVMGR